MRAGPDRRSHAGSKPFQPAIGRDFPISDVPAIEARTRGFLARGLAIFVQGSLALSGGYALWTRDYLPLEAVSAVGGPIGGAMVAYYFGPQRKDAE